MTYEGNKNAGTSMGQGETADVWRICPEHYSTVSLRLPAGKSCLHTMFPAGATYKHIIGSLKGCYRGHQLERPIESNHPDQHGLLDPATSRTNIMVIDLDRQAPHLRATQDTECHNIRLQQVNSHPCSIPSCPLGVTSWLADRACT